MSARYLIDKIIYKIFVEQSLAGTTKWTNIFPIIGRTGWSDCYLDCLKWKSVIAIFH